MKPDYAGVDIQGNGKGYVLNEILNLYDFWN